MEHNVVSDVWNLIVKDLEIEKFKRELKKEACQIVRKEYAKEHEVFIKEQRGILARLASAANEAERCAVQYQDNLNRFLR